MNQHQQPEPGFSWGHIFFIAIVIFMVFVTAKEVGIFQSGKQAKIKYSDIKPSGLVRP